MEFFNAPYLTIHRDDVYNCVWMEWKKFVKGPGYRNGLDKGLELAISMNTTRWLADLRKMNVVDPDDQSWSNDNWFPRALKGGIENIAIIMPQDVFAKMSVDSIMEKVPASMVKVRYFERLEMGQNWLNTQ